MDVRILYEDNHVIAVYKPAGILVQGDKTGDLCLMDAVKAFIKKRDHKPGNVFLGLLHRLDRPVGGVMLFAKTSKGAARLSEQIRNRSIQKTYHAVVIGTLKEPQGTLVHFLKKDERKNIVDVYDKNVSGSLRAELDYEVVDDKRVQRLFTQIHGFTNTSVVKITLKTGRPHQIRAQMSAIGHPILGDVKYGADKPLGDKSVALLATSLRFKKATGGEVVEVVL